MTSWFSGVSSLVAPNQRLDWNKGVITGKDLDLKNYRNKFKVWDYVVENKLLEAKNPDIRNKATLLLDDETIYAYAFLRDDEGKPFEYTAYQDAIGNLKHDFTPTCPNRYIIFMASNQIGKSRLLIGKAIKTVFTEENKNVVIISKSLPQSQFLLAQLRHALDNSVFGQSWREDLGDTANTTIFTVKREKTFSNGRKQTILNRLICAPAGEGTLGYPVHYLFLDEADFYEDAKEFFWKVAFARTKKTKGQIILFSNPNPLIPRSTSLLWELWNGDLFKRKFSFNFLDAPWNTREEYEEDKRNSPSYIFQSTHDGVFPVEGGAFLSHSELQDMFRKDWNNELPATDKQVFIGLDLGKMFDQTVLSLGITKDPMFKEDKLKDLDVRYQRAFPVKTDYKVIAMELRDLINHYRSMGCSVVVGFDATGQKTFGDVLKAMGISAIPVDFSKKESNKTLLINDFKLMAENRKIKVVYSRQCENQLSMLEFTQTENKKLKTVEHKTEGVHDDYFDSLMILVHIAVKPSRVPVTVVNTGHKIDEIIKKQQETVPEFDREELAMKQAIEANKQKNMFGYGRSGPW